MSVVRRSRARGVDGPATARWTCWTVSVAADQPGGPGRPYPELVPAVDLPAPGMGGPRDRETDLDTPREWVTFIDPADPQHEVRADLTWLLSSWTCIFGAGCHGIVPGGSDDGCCTHGAHFSDDDDRRRTLATAQRLTPQLWSRYGTKRLTEKVEADPEPDADADAPVAIVRKTRVVDGACVFLNPPGWPTGAGCALHTLALAEGVHPLTTKPDVCWQLPVRRSQEWVTRPDDTTVLVSTLGEFDRRGWGAGGHELAWWCTGAPEAHVGVDPLYVSYAPQLTALVGAQAYAVLARLCEQRLTGRGPLLPHPATVGAERS